MYMHSIASQDYGSLGRGEAGNLRQRSIRVSIATRTPFCMSLLHARFDQEEDYITIMPATLTQLIWPGSSDLSKTGFGATGKMDGARM